MEQKPTIPGLFSYDEVDAFVAAVFQRCEQLFSPSEKRDVEPPFFNDEWERRQMARELRWN
jgi:hypothetical protein